jgi:protein TonB
MIKSLGQLGLLATIAGACLAVSPGAQAQDASFAPAHVDLSAGNLQPAYPATAITNREEGTVVVGVLVSSNGRPTHLKLDRSSGYDDLDDAAIAAVMGWKFVPAMRGGETDQDRIDVGVNFQLPASSSP